MNVHYTPYILPLLAAAAMAAVPAVFAWGRRAKPGVTPFIITEAAIVGLSLANGLELAGVDLSTKSFWANVQYLGYAAVPVTWLALIIQYTGHDRWLTRRYLACLCVIPILTVAMAWSNDLHGLMRQDLYLDANGPFPVLGMTYGPWFWVHTAYSYLLLAASVLLLLEFQLRMRFLYRGQILALVVATFLPTLGSALYIFGLSPLHRFDPTPVLMGVSGIIVAWALLRHRLFDIVPVARHKVVDSMSDGVVVLDLLDRIVDLNPAAAAILGCTSSEAIGLHSSKLFAAWPGLIGILRSAAGTHAELALGKSETPRYYDARASLLTDQWGHPTGRVVTLREVTERRRMEDALRESERKYREMADPLPETIFEMDLTGRLNFVNRGGLEMFGCTQEDLERGIYVLDFIAPEDRERAMAGIGRVASGQPQQDHGYRFQRKDGTPFPGAIQAEAIVRAGRPVGLRGFIVDMTGYHQVQTRLLEQERALAHMEARERVIDAEERLRREIAELLHGPVQTRLLVAWFRLGECQGLLDTDPAAARALLEDVRAEIEQVREHDVRQASHLLHPSIISVGLVPALRSLAANFEDQLRVSLQVDPALARLDDPLHSSIPERLRLVVYRIVEESLNNVCRHARANSVMVSLGVTPELQLSVFVEDDGVGFDTSRVKPGLGLGSLAGRVDQIGGSWQISSAAGHGTRLSALLPIADGDCAVAPTDSPGSHL